MKKLPRVMLGANPFHGVSHKSAGLRREYKMRFNSPDSIYEVIKKSTELGVKAVHLYANNNEIEAVYKAKDECDELRVIAVIPDVYGAAGRQMGASTTGKDYTKLKFFLKNLPSLLTASFSGDITRLLSKILEDELRYIWKTEPDFVLLHATPADIACATEQQEAMEMFNEKIRAFGAIPGIATHNLVNTYNKLKNMGVNIPLIMSPVNPKGFMMTPSKDECINVIEAIRNSNDFVFIAKKVLAGGILPPKDALRFVFDEIGVYSAAIGIASVSEAEKTFSTAREILGHRFNEEKNVS